MKYQILNENGDTLIVTSAGYKVWIKPGEWFELNKIVESNAISSLGYGDSYRGYGDSYCSEFDEGIAKYLMKNEPGAYLVKYKNHFETTGKLAIVALVIIGLYSLIKHVTAGEQ